MLTATPPDLPGGRAVGSRNSLRGFQGREGSNRAGEVVEYFGRAVLDIELETPRSAQTVLSGMIAEEGG